MMWHNLIYNCKRSFWQTCGAWRERGSQNKKRSRNEHKLLPCSKREMMMACITVQGNCGGYKNCLASGCISKVNPTLYFRGKGKYLIWPY